MARRIPIIDPAVVARAACGDRPAQADVYRVFAPMVFTLARRMLASASLAEDVLQDTFVTVIGKLPDYRGEAEVGYWIRRIAVNECLMHLRSAWATRRVDNDDAELRAPAEGARVAERQHALERALDALSGTARVVVWLHDVEGYTHREIGKAMGRSTSFSKSQLARAHERLRQSLEGALDERESELCIPVLKTC